MATKYRLHKQLGAMYRESGYVGTYGQWLREEVGYTKGGHGAQALTAVVGRWRDRIEKKKAGGGGGGAGAAGAG